MKHLVPTALYSTIIALGASPLAAASTTHGSPVPDPHYSLTAGLAVYKTAARPSAAPGFYRVRRGDTLSSIARRAYGHSDRWPALWWINKRKIRNPNMVRTGQRLRLSDWRPEHAWLMRAAVHAIPVPPPVRHAVAPSAPAVTAPVATVPLAASAPSGGSYGGAPGSFQSCVIAAESSGNSQVMNSTGHYGLYQFDLGTWKSGGGSAADFGHASVAEQNQVFQRVYAKRGTSPWAPYDGC